MKIEKVSENKIKVTISQNDLDERNIDLSSLNYNSPAAQELFWDMMEQAEIEFGFNSADSQLCIEATPDSIEGFIITITKLDEENDFESIQKYIKNRFKKSDLRTKRKNKKVCSSVMVYCFNSFEDICGLANKIHSIYSGDSTLFRLKNYYYLVLTRYSFGSPDTKSTEIILSEFGRKINNSSFYEGYLNEYGTKIVEYNALETIKSYF
ncbi:MAG: adaptor protein MecA [Bacillota bacterium]|nr:adaptor protein MecA [Bacillota bacterium]